MPDDMEARLSALIARLNPAYKNAAATVMREALKIVEEERATSAGIATQSETKIAARMKELEGQVASLESRLSSIADLAKVQGSDGA